MRCVLPTTTMFSKESSSHSGRIRTIESTPGQKFCTCGEIRRASLPPPLIRACRLGLSAIHSSRRWQKNRGRSSKCLTLSAQPLSAAFARLSSEPVCPGCRVTSRSLLSRRRDGLSSRAPSGGRQRCQGFVLADPILAASGVSGPKREGDKQVPEGFYRIELLNPNSRYHLSLRVNYPNADDLERARQDGRALSTLGGDIMIHGGSASIGCLALGDPAVGEALRSGRARRTSTSG